MILAVAVTMAMAASGPPSWAVALFPDGTEFSLEVAADDPARSRGYMGREKIGPQEGMLFVFERSEHRTFWMKNCLVPLDMVWLDDAFRVVAITPDRPPCPPRGPCPQVDPLVTSRYVLEFAAGTARAHALSRGDRVVILSEPPIP